MEGSVPRALELGGLVDPLNVPNEAVMLILAVRSQVAEQLRYRVLGGVGHARGGAYGGTFNQGTNNGGLALK